MNMLKLPRSTVENDVISEEASKKIVCFKEHFHDSWQMIGSIFSTVDFSHPETDERQIYS